jgi:uncharacterized protein YjbJ (UPF0337 family)
MNWDQVESRWKQLMGSAKENWGKLTDDDLDQISGKRERLAGKIQETYGITRREAEKQVWDWGKSVERTSEENCASIPASPRMKPSAGE